MYILGISCFYHDSAACLIRDGMILAAAQEERFTRSKHDAGFPAHAVRWCLEHEGIGVGDLAYVVFYEKPFVKFERLLETYLACAPVGIRQFLLAMPAWLTQRLWIPQVIEQELGYRGKVIFCGHHEAHAASAFYPSGFEDAAILTMDGVGEWETASFGIGAGNEISLCASLHFPHSLGLLYSAFTYYAGFKVNSGEYKLMGLAPYGQPVFAERILKELIDLKADGSFRLNTAYFGYISGLKMINRKFERLFGRAARKPETAITRHEMDIAASIQQVTEEVMLRMARHVRKVTGKDRLCLAGGVALNCVGNARILRESGFKQLWIQPASGDAGAALGAALVCWHRYLGNARHVGSGQDSQGYSFLGPEYSDRQIEEVLQREKAVYSRIAPEELPAAVAALIAQSKVIGWFQGRMEFGPRALGGRSIIGDARDPSMQSRMNLKIKFRESFRPFAPTVLADHAQEWFDLAQQSPYMLLVAAVRAEKRLTRQPVQGDGLEALKSVRSLIPAVTHVDYSARLQTITRQAQPLFYDTIEAFYRLTGCPLIINTSFNVRGEPLVCSPEDALRCFMRTEMDYLVMGNFILDKARQQAAAPDSAWQREFALD